MVSKFAFYPSLLLVPWGAYTLGHLLVSLAPWSDPIMEQCNNPATATIRTRYTSIPGVDQFLCLMVPFFQNCFANPVGITVSSVLVQLFMVVCLFVTIEAKRKGLSSSPHWLSTRIYHRMPASWRFCRNSPFMDSYLHL